jgi:hypothetical protein
VEEEEMIVLFTVAAAAISPCSPIRFDLANPAGGVTTMDAIFVSAVDDGFFVIMSPDKGAPMKVPGTHVQSVELGAIPIAVDAPIGVRRHDRERWEKLHKECNAARALAADERVREIEDALNDELAAALKKIESESLTFTLPKAKAGDAWGRANVFVAKHASMKTQVSTEYAVETYSPSGDDTAFGYQITRTPDGGVVKFEVVVTTNHPHRPSALRRMEFNGRIAAHYIRTGVLVCEKCISK